MMGPTYPAGSGGNGGEADLGPVNARIDDVEQRVEDVDARVAAVEREPTDNITAHWVYAGSPSDNGDGVYIPDSGGIVIGGPLGVRYRHEGFVHHQDEGSIASYPNVPNRANRLALCPSGNPETMVGEDTASLALQRRNGDTEERFCVISKKAGEYRLASVATNGGSHFPITVAPGAYRVARFDTDGATTFTAEALAGGGPRNTVVRFANPAVPQFMRFFGRTSGQFGVEYVGSSGSVTEYRINSVGLGIGGVDAATRVHAHVTEASVGGYFARFTHPSFAGYGVTLDVDRTANSGYAYFLARSAVAGAFDIEFNLRGDGNAFADGAWNANGADYAEFFEWEDGNPAGEDRVGMSVVLVGDRIRPAAAGDDPFGVVSGMPSVVGNAAGNAWRGKYALDDFGRVVLGEDGEPVLDPDFDPALEYVPRELRREWSPVGLMGRLRIRKGQPTGSRWLKLSDVGTAVEEWLVR